MSRRVLLTFCAGLTLVLVASAVFVAASQDQDSDDLALTSEFMLTQERVFDSTTATQTDVDEFSETLTDANGVSQATIGFVPRFTEVSGNWEPVNNELSRVDDTFFAPLHTYSPEFTVSNSGTPLVRVERGGHTLKIEVPDAQSASPSPRESNPLAAETGVVYKNVFDGVNLHFGLDDGLLSEAFEVPDYESLAGRDWKWRITHDGLEPAQVSDGSIELRDASGVPVFTFAPPNMWDSSRDGQLSTSAAVPASQVLEVVSNTVVDLMVLPDFKWAAEPERIFPIYLDPQINGTLITAFKQSGVQAAGVVQIGNSKETGTCCDWRSTVKYELSPYSGKRILSAYIAVSRRSGSVGNSESQTGSVHHATAFNFAGVGTNLSPLTVTSSGYATNQNLGKWVAQQLNANTFTGFLMIRGNEDNNAYSYKAIDTVLVIEYVNRAVVTGITGATPKNGQRNVDRAEVQATGAEYTGYGQEFRYEFTSTNGGTAWTSPWVAPGPYVLPEATLSAGKHYKLQISTRDNVVESPITSRTEAGWNFYTAQAPAVPTQFKVDGTAFDANRVLTNPRPTLSVTVSDADGGKVQAMFRVIQNGVVVAEAIPGSVVTLATPGGSGVSTAQVPYDLVAGSGYTVEAWAFDGTYISGSVRPSPQLFGTERSVREIPGDDDTEIGEKP